MRRSRGTRTQPSGIKQTTKSEIKTKEHIDASVSADVVIRNTYNNTTQVYTKGYAMSGLSAIAPSSHEESAKITVSFDLSAKSYGNGAGIMVSVTLNCKQNDASVKLGYDLARSICEAEGEEALRKAQEVFERTIREG